jgi:hypothetical protein
VKKVSMTAFSSEREKMHSNQVFTLNITLFGPPNSQMQEELHFLLYTGDKPGSVKG